SEPRHGREARRRSFVDTVRYRARQPQQARDAIRQTGGVELELLLLAIIHHLQQVDQQTAVPGAEGRRIEANDARECVAPRRWGACGLVRRHELWRAESELPVARQHGQERVALRNEL